MSKPYTSRTLSQRRAWFPRCAPAMALTLCALLGQPALLAQGPSPAVKTGSAPARLLGRWQRPDGGYIMEIKGATMDGKLTVLYFNPNPIHVARAEWAQKNGALGIFVELRAPNYPGSVYTLMLSADGKRLTGNYFQAAQKADYAVEFLRQP